MNGGVDGHGWRGGRSVGQTDGLKTKHTTTNDEQLKDERTKDVSSDYQTPNILPVHNPGRADGVLVTIQPGASSTSKRLHLRRLPHPLVSSHRRPFGRCRIDHSTLPSTPHPLALAPRSPSYLRHAPLPTNGWMDGLKDKRRTNDERLQDEWARTHSWMEGMVG